MASPITLDYHNICVFLQEVSEYLLEARMDRFCQSGVDGLWETWNGGYGQDRDCLCGGKVYKEVGQGTPLSGRSQGRAVGTLYVAQCLRACTGAIPRDFFWFRHLFGTCSWAGSAVSLGLGFLVCEISVTVVTTSWGLLCPEQVDSWKLPGV